MEFDIDTFLFVTSRLYLSSFKTSAIFSEACEKTFCRWGAECVTLNNGRAHCACPTTCPSTNEPVCSTGGRTHRNQCFLRKEACERRLNLRIKHDGECGNLIYYFLLRTLVSVKETYLFYVLLILFCFIQLV